MDFVSGTRDYEIGINRASCYVGEIFEISCGFVQYLAWVLAADQIAQGHLIKLFAVHGYLENRQILL